MSSEIISGSMPVVHPINKTIRPVALPVRADMIPDVQKKHDRWIIWKFVWSIEKGEWLKEPYRAGLPGIHASSGNPKSWASFDYAYRQYLSCGFDGIGYATGDGESVFVDLDDCRNKETGEIEEKAAARVADLDTYTEASQSGEGLKLIAFGKLPDADKRSGGVRRGGVEVYDKGQFIYLTGHVLDGRCTVEERTEQVGRLYEEIAEPRVQLTKLSLPPRGNDGAESLPQRGRLVLRATGPGSAGVSDDYIIS
jgi:putative DNA primase/helicase